MNKLTDNFDTICVHAGHPQKKLLDNNDSNISRLQLLSNQTLEILKYTTILMRKPYTDCFRRSLSRIRKSKILLFLFPLVLLLLVL